MSFTSRFPCMLQAKRNGESQTLNIFYWQALERRRECTAPCVLFSSSSGKEWQEHRAVGKHMAIFLHMGETEQYCKDTFICVHAMKEIHILLFPSEMLPNYKADGPKQSNLNKTCMYPHIMIRACSNQQHITE